MRTMTSYEEFPLATVVYNAVTLGGTLLVGVVVAAQYGLWAAVGYLALLIVAGGGVLATICTRCRSYYGRRCGLGLGKIVARIFPKGREEQYLGTVSQLAVLPLIVLAMLLPVIGSIALLVTTLSVWHVILTAVTAALLLAGVVPHSRLVCSHCRQGECGACPVGQKLWQRK